MSSNYTLQFTAADIDNKLAKIDTLVSSVNGVTPVNGNVELNIGGSGEAIIDVLELPTENINEKAFYRLLTGRFIANGEEVTGGSVCYCVNGLPESGQVVTNADMSLFIAYYNVADNDVYGYVDAMLGAAFSVPAGWYPFSALAQIANVGFNGIATDIEDLPHNGYFGVLLSKDFYIYQDGWMKVPFACERAPEFDIQWDGVIGDKFALDMSALGYVNTYFVKVSDEVFSAEQLIGGRYTQNSGYCCDITEHVFDTMTYPGAMVVGDGIVIVHTADDLNSALGLPAGYMTNGVYFVLVVDENYTDRLVGPSKIIKIDEKFLPDMSVDINSLGLHSVATTGNYNSLNNKPNLSNYVTTSQLSSYVKKTEVETMINNAIGNMIGGSY